MSSDTIKAIAIGFLSVPNRPQHHEELLATALTSALAFYSAVRPLHLCVIVSGSAVRGEDESGEYSEFDDVPLSSGIIYASIISIAGQQYRFRIAGISTTMVTVRIYAALSGAVSLEIWCPAVHTAAIASWPAHHEGIIGLFTAAFYLNAVSLLNADYRVSEMMQTLATSYMGRAQAALQL